MAITPVGELAFNVQSGAGSENKTLPGPPIEHDVVVIVCGSDDAFTIADILTSGYTQVEATGGTSPGGVVAIKRMGSTPDTVVQIDQDGAVDTTGAVQVWRGVDTTTALDMAAVETSGASGDPDPGSATTVTPGALRIIIGVVDDDDAATASAPAGYGNFISSNTGNASTSVGATVMMASKIAASAGAEDPGAFTASSDDAWFAYHFALRPAAGGGTDTPQTITVSATASVSMSRSAGKVIAATCSSAVTMARAIAKRISATATGAVSVGKAATRTLAVAASAAVTVRKAAGKVIDATSSAAVALATSLQFAKTITVAATASVSMARGIGKTIAATGTASVSVAKGVAHSIAVAAASTTSMGKAVGKTIAASVTAAVLLTALAGAQMFYQTISVSVGAAVTVQKGIAKRISVTVASLVALLANSSVFVFGMNIVLTLFQSRTAVVPPVSARIVAVPHQQRIVVVPAEGRVIDVEPTDRDAETLEQTRTVRVEDD